MAAARKWNGLNEIRLVAGVEGVRFVLLLLNCCLNYENASFFVGAGVCLYLFI